MCLYSVLLPYLLLTVASRRGRGVGDGAQESIGTLLGGGYPFRKLVLKNNYECDDVGHLIKNFLWIGPERPVSSRPSLYTLMSENRKKGSLLRWLILHDK